MRFSSFLGAAVLLAFASPRAHAQVTSLAYWDFNDGAPVGGQMNQSVRDALFEADGGANAATTAVMESDFLARDAASNLADGINSFAGTNLDAAIPGVGTVPAGQALALQGGITNFPNDATNTPNNGRILEFGVSTEGYHDLSISFAARGTAFGFSSVQFQYSGDGLSFVDFGPLLDLRSPTFAAKKISLSSATELEDDPNVRFRLVFDGATSPLGNNRIDNLQINGVKLGGLAAAPEPSAGLLVFVGLGLLCLVRLLRLDRRRTGRSISLWGADLPAVDLPAFPAMLACLTAPCYNRIERAGVGERLKLEG